LQVKKPLGIKLYYSISEVAELTDLQPYTLRAWEKEFACLRPKRARGKNRAYRERDIGIVLLIKQLLYQERYTTQGVKQKLKNEPELLRQAAVKVGILLSRETEKKKVQQVSETIARSPQRQTAPQKAVPVDDRAAGPDLRLREAIAGIKKELQDLLRLL